MHMIPGVICCSFAIVIDFRSDLRPTSILLWPRPFLQYDIQKIIPKGRESRSWQRPFPNCSVPKRPEARTLPNGETLLFK